MPLSLMKSLAQLTGYLLPFSAYPYRGQEVPCPVCGSVNQTEVSGVDRRWKRLRTVGCGECGLLFTNPMPTEAELDDYYASLYRLDYQGAVVRPSARHIRKRSAQAARRVSVIKTLLSPNAATLDFGTGSGEFILAMLEVGYDAHGFEPGGTYSSFARQRLGDRIRAGRWQDMDYGPRFDLITSFHVFEHLSDPVSAFRAAVSWLKPGGLIYIEVPDAVSGFKQSGFMSLHFAHVVGFNAHNLMLAAAKAGLEPVHHASATEIVFRRAERPLELYPLADAGAKLTRDMIGRSANGNAN
jgi:SAM-dependent methyltransferase